MLSPLILRSGRPAPSPPMVAGLLVVWNPKVEFMPQQELDELQLKLLKTMVYRLYNFSPFYKERMKAANVTPDDINTLADVTKLPFMTKKDLRDFYPDHLFTVPRREIVRYHASSGTTGKPTIVAYTRSDIEMWSESLARALCSIAWLATTTSLGHGPRFPVPPSVCAIWG